MFDNFGTSLHPRHSIVFLNEMNTCDTLIKLFRWYMFKDHFLTIENSDKYLSVLQLRILACYDPIIPRFTYF